MLNYTKLLFERTKRSLTERSRASKLMRGIAGKDPKVKSYAILTAENPYGEPHDSDTNTQLNKDLETELRRMGKGFVKIKGQFFGNTENSYFIPNVSQEEATTLGNQFKQESVIQGDKEEGPDGPQMKHKYIVGDEIRKTRRTFRQLSRDLEDMYSKVKGRKFEFPLFNDATAGQEFVGRKPKDTGAADLNLAADTGPGYRDPEKEKVVQSYLSGKIKILNPSGREVWVNKENKPYYLKKGYKPLKAG